MVGSVGWLSCKHSTSESNLFDSSVEENAHAVRMVRVRIQSSTIIGLFFRNGSLYIFFSANARLSQSKIVGAWLVHGRDNKRFKLARWREAISKARRP